jgi:copper resistance protein B
MPYRFETDAAAFVSEDGDFSLSLELEYELLLTQRLVLQPRLELNAAAQRVRAWGVGRGLNDLQLGLRLRYEIRREFAPYVGVEWVRRFGDTADLARDEGERVGNLGLVAGVRLWF